MRTKPGKGKRFCPGCNKAIGVGNFNCPKCGHPLREKLAANLANGNGHPSTLPMPTGEAVSHSPFTLTSGPSCEEKIKAGLEFLRLAGGAVAAIEMLEFIDAYRNVARERMQTVKSANA